MRRLLACCLLLVACDDEPTPSDARVDARVVDGGGLDASEDAAPDGAVDAAVDARIDAALDASRDAALDSGVDAAADAGEDAAVDALIDAVVDAGPPPHPLRLNEAMADNEGAWLDAEGEADDWFELYNAGPEPLLLAGFRVGDKRNDGHLLPAIELAPGATQLFWADDTPAQGQDHLPFKLSAGGETLYLWSPDGTLIDTMVLPPSAPNDSFQRMPDGQGPPIRCRFASPERANGEVCGPPPPPELPEEVVFPEYAWAEPWPFPPTPLAVTEIALRPAGFVEVLNVGDAALDLADFALRLAPQKPGQPWPARDQGALLAWPVARLAPGERVAVPVPVEATAVLEADPEFEGVLTLWAAAREFPVERIDFMWWPQGAALTRLPDATGRHIFCARTTPGQANAACDPLASRPIGDRLRHIRTPGDYAALGANGEATGIESVKAIIDMQAGDTVHLLSSAWDLHYTFVRERIEGLPHLDRCDPQQNAEQRRGWQTFSEINYFQVEGRRYLLGTLNIYGGSGLQTLEFSPGDRISVAQMRRAFFGAVAHVADPTAWALRPQTGDQVATMQALGGQAPIVDPNAPFRGLNYQPLTETVGYGVLTFVPTEDLETARLGPEVLVVTDQVPNDIALVGGLITEAFQTPLAHVNLLARNRNTPNMALRGARQHPDLAPFFGQLVRLEVGPARFVIEAADPAEAQAFWESRRPQGPPVAPRLDTTVRGLVPLAGRGIADLPSLGAKAAQLAELARVNSNRQGCMGPVNTPANPAAVAVVHSLEHYEASGARALLAELRADPRFADPAVRGEGLARVRALIEAHPVDPVLLAQVEAYMAMHFGEAEVRFRSSSNTEDLPGFNGAGLYFSVSGQLGPDSELPPADALRAIWASLYNLRAYDERTYHGIAQEGVAMGVLLHPAFLSEQANGVGISRDIIEPIREDAYLNVQRGEATVTNPAPGVTSEEIILRYFREPRINVLGRSSLNRGLPVLTDPEIEQVACVLRAIHEHFRPLIDPARENRWFAMDIEFKLLGPERRLLVKQARPYSFGSREVPDDCRSL